MKFLVYTTDVIPLPNHPTSGTALRTYGLIQGLRSCGHEVIVSVPKSALNAFKNVNDLNSLAPETKKLIDELSEYAFNPENQSFILANTTPDAIICGHWPAMGLRAKPSQALIVDLAGPHLLERHYLKAVNQHDAILGKLGVICASDYFIVSGESQKNYFKSFMTRAGIIGAENRILTIPMPLDPVLPPLRTASQPGENYPHFIFGGVFLPWQDPSASLRTLEKELKARNSGKLSLIGGKHPHYPIESKEIGRLFEELEKNSRVTTKPMLAYDCFIKELQSADVAIDLMAWNLERELAVTIRTTTYLWSGLPIIYNNFSDLSKEIAKYDAGWCIDPTDNTALKSAIEEIYKNPELVLKKSHNARRLAAELFSWDKAVLPIVEILKSKHELKQVQVDIVLDHFDDAKLNVFKQKPLKQFFQCRLNGLSKIECKIKARELDTNSQVALSLYQLNSQDSKACDFREVKKFKLLARQLSSSDQLKNDSWHSLNVAPIEDSAGKTYVLEIENCSTIETKNTKPWTVRNAPYPLLGLYHGAEKVKNAALCMRTTCTK